MALPSGPRARAKLGFYARERRRKKQDQKDFEIAGFTPAAPFNFGTVAAGGSSTNAMTLPAQAELALEINAITTAGQLGILDVTTGVDYVSADPGQAGGRINIRRLFPESHQIRITRAVGAPAGTVAVYFRGPKSQLVQIGTATFT